MLPRSGATPLISTLAFFLTLCRPLVGPAQTAGLMATYAFNETSGTTTVDASGEGNTATLTNGATFVAGKNGNAVSLNKTTQYIKLNKPTVFQLTRSMPVSAWINSSWFPVDDAEANVSVNVSSAPTSPGLL